MALQFSSIMDISIPVDGTMSPVKRIMDKATGRVLWNKYKEGFAKEFVAVDAGKTHTVGLYRGRHFAMVIGAGGGGAWSDSGRRNNYFQWVTGGGGSAICGYFNVYDNNTYATITIGAVGSSNGPYDFDDYNDGIPYTGTTGGETTLLVGNRVAKSYGGTGGWCADKGSRQVYYGNSYKEGTGASYPSNSLFDSVTYAREGYNGDCSCVEGSLPNPINYAPCPLNGVTMTELSVVNFLNTTTIGSPYPTIDGSEWGVGNPIPGWWWGRSGGMSYNIYGYRAHRPGWVPYYYAANGLVGIWWVGYV